MNIYKNKTILITGASSGIGECFAQNLDKLGSTLILTARSENKLLEMASRMKDAHVIAGDLSKKEFIKWDIKVNLPVPLVPENREAFGSLLLFIKFL